MEAAVAGVGKVVLNCLLSGAKAAIEADVASKQGVQRGVIFLTDELAEMQRFLTAADEEQNKDKVPGYRVKQTQDLAYDVEDCLQDYVVHLEKPSWWHLPRTRLERHRIAEEMKGLRARVEDMAQRNKRYRLMEDLRSKPAIAAAAMVSDQVNEASRPTKNYKQADLDLKQLIDTEDQDRGVIAVWGTSSDLGQTSIIREAYENPHIKSKFPCRAWVRVMHPFNPKDFLQSLVEQFLQAATVGVDVLLELEMRPGELLAAEFKRHVNEKRYLIVLNDISTIEEWDRVINCFPDKKNGSRIIVSTTQVEAAKLCAGQESIVSELRQLSLHQTIYAFHHKGPQDGTGHQSEIAAGNNRVVGRNEELHDIARLISNQDTQQSQVIAVSGPAGAGKTTLVKCIYQKEALGIIFKKCACVTRVHTFSLEELFGTLLMQLDAETSITKNVMGWMPLPELIMKLTTLLERNRYLIILDDVSSTAQWDLITASLPPAKHGTLIIVTTRELDIAKHCAKNKYNIYQLGPLREYDQWDLFFNKVFRCGTDLHEIYPELRDEGRMILKKCNGLPHAIAAMGDFLANQPKTALEWRKLNERIIAELEINPNLGLAIVVFNKRYNDLPYHLKSCILYMSIFSKDHKVRRRRLVRRWIAEGYSWERRGKSVEEIADNYFMELISKRMILPSQPSIYSIKRSGSCQVDDFIHEIGISKSIEEGFVFRLEEGCSLNNQGTVRHLVICSNWKRNQREFKNIVYLSRLRSVTVFGKWKPYFISEKMRSLRVLDLEGTSGLVNRDLDHIGKLLHLKYLSLRGCADIFLLPDSLGNLRQLETLDIRQTSIMMLPKAVTKLRKLQYLRAGRKSANEEEEQIMSKRIELLHAGPHLCASCCLPQRLSVDGFNRRDACNFACCVALPYIMMDLEAGGVTMPRGMRIMEALETLGVMNLACGDAVLQEMKWLTGLRKLGVVGINQKNGPMFSSAISNLSRLKSLSVRSDSGTGFGECLDDITMPRNLQSLKLLGKLGNLPKWIEGNRNLVKLTLRGTRLELHAVIRVLRDLPNLAILRLLKGSFEGEEVCLSFHHEAFPSRVVFPSLVVLQLDLVGNVESVRFEYATAPRLELLQFRGWPSRTNSRLFHGLECLQNLKEVLLDHADYNEGFVENLWCQLDKNPNGPVLNRL